MFDEKDVKAHSFVSGRVSFMCPGCRKMHQVFIEGPNAQAYNGDTQSPTFKGEVVATGAKRPTLEEDELIMAGKMQPKPMHCRGTITQGFITFGKDCSHEMSGKTAELPLLVVNDSGKSS